MSHPSKHTTSPQRRCCDVVCLLGLVPRNRASRQRLFQTYQVMTLYHVYRYIQCVLVNTLSLHRVFEKLGKQSGKRYFNILL